MLISKDQIKVAKLAGTDDSHPLLEQVKIYKEDGKIVTVATDSYILAEVIEETPNAEDYPTITEDQKYTDPEVALVPATVLAELAKKLKVKKTLPILSYGVVEKGKITTTDLDTTTVLSFKEIEGQYPDYRKLMARFAKKGKVTLTVNPKLLIKALSLFNNEQTVDVTIHMDSNGLTAKFDPMLLSNENNGIKKTAVVMPLKS